MTILDCPMCPWRAGVVGGKIAEAYITKLHIDYHCEEFAEEMGGMNL